MDNKLLNVYLECIGKVKIQKKNVIKENAKTISQKNKKRRLIKEQAEDGKPWAYFYFCMEALEALYEDHECKTYAELKETLEDFNYEVFQANNVAWVKQLGSSPVGVCNLFVAALYGPEDLRKLLNTTNDKVFGGMSIAEIEDVAMQDVENASDEEIFDVVAKDNAKHLTWGGDYILTKEPLNQEDADLFGGVGSYGGYCDDFIEHLLDNAKEYYDDADEGDGDDDTEE